MERQRSAEGRLLPSGSNCMAAISGWVSGVLNDGFGHPPASFRRPSERRVLHQGRRDGLLRHGRRAVAPQRGEITRASVPATSLRAWPPMSAIIGGRPRGLCG